jgi:hypothetical protein
MSKLIRNFLAYPSDEARARLQKYLTRHPMAICLATPEENQILKQHGFKG